ERRAGPSVKRTKETLTISSLNMKGKAVTGNVLPLNKWQGLNKVIRERHIGILALQETHLTEPDVESLTRMYPNIRVFSSRNETHPNREGVAFVINRQMTHADGVTLTEIIPGRAILLRIPWHGSMILQVLNIYAPNSPADNTNFWNTLPRPDIVLGDFNLVEDAIDRIPCHADADAPVEALNAFMHGFHLHDGWRSSNPMSKAFTFVPPNNAYQSRLDRIYTTHRIYQNALNWTISDSSIPTDHNLVSVQIIDADAPFIGQGRRTLPLALMRDKKFMTGAAKIMKKYLPLIRNSRLQQTATHNPQTLMKESKNELTNLAHEQAIVAVPQLRKTIARLEKDLQDTLN
ncbi:Endonuclease/exonuclease/phosphatase, partial [Amylostereum chailletii]